MNERSFAFWKNNGGHVVRQERTRDRILDAAETLIIEEGVQMSMARLAERAGVAVGSIYNHFASKTDLVRAVCDRFDASFERSLVIADRSDAPGRQRLESYIYQYIDLFWTNPDRAVLFEYLSSQPVIPQGELVERFAITTRHIMDILKQLEEEGDLASDNPSILGAFIGGAIRNALKWHRVQGTPMSEDLRKEIARLCLCAALKTETSTTD